MGLFLGSSVVTRPVGRMWPLLQSHTIQSPLQSSILNSQEQHTEDSGWGQLTVPTAGLNSAGRATGTWENRSRHFGLGMVLARLAEVGW